MVYNIMTCGGFGTTIFGPCSQAWFVAVFLFFIVLLCRKWLGEEFNLGFNTIFAFAGTYLVYFIIITITGSIRYSFLGGLIGLLVGGFVIGYFYDTSGGESYGEF